MAHGTHPMLVALARLDLVALDFSYRRTFGSLHKQLGSLGMHSE